MINMSNDTKVPDSLGGKVAAFLISLEGNKMLYYHHGHHIGENRDFMTSEKLLSGIVRFQTPDFSQT